MKKKGEGNGEILFKKGKIQGLNRVVIPEELLENIGVKKGDSIAIYFDILNSSVVLKKDGNTQI